jgi:Flp pilus assembly protein TadD
MDGMNHFQHLIRAQQLQSLGRLDDAIAEMRKAVLASPESAVVRGRLAILLADRGKPVEAEYEAREAVRHGPDEESAFYGLAYALYMNDKTKLALEAAQRSVELAPLDAHNQAMLATILGRLNRWEESNAAAEAALAVDPHNSGAIAARAAALRALGRPDEAEATLREQLGHDAEDEIAHCRLGWHTLRLGRRREALSHFREALRLDPNYADARQGLAAAMQSRSPIFGWLFRMQAALADKQATILWALLFGVLFGPRLLARLDRSNAPLQMGVAALQFVFFMFFMLWLLMPVLGLLILRADTVGRATLTPDELRSSRWQLVVLGFLLLIAVSSPLTNRMFALQGMTSALATALCVHHLFAAPPGEERRLNRVVLGIVLALCVPMVVLLAIPSIVPASTLPLSFMIAIGIYFYLGLYIAMIALALGVWGDDLARWVAGRREAEMRS